MSPRGGWSESPGELHICFLSVRTKAEANCACIRSGYQVCLPRLPSFAAHPESRTSGIARLSLSQSRSQLPHVRDQALVLLTANLASTFSPEGRLFQVEYSLEAIKLGSTAIGVATSEGVILGVEKRVTSTLLETSSVEKIVEIDRHIGCAMSGLQADARSMVEHARVECQSHAFNFNEKLSVESCTQAICDLALRFGESADGEAAS